jgi:hypothetical protein
VNLKEGFGRKVADKFTVEVGGGAVGAKAGSEVADEATETYEYQLTTARKISGQQYTRLTIGSPIKGVAYWQLLDDPRQPLQGGLSFFATAYVPGRHDPFGKVVTGSRAPRRRCGAF